MKNNKQSLFLSNFIASIQTSQGLMQVPVSSYCLFDDVLKSSFLEDLSDSAQPFKIVRGTPSTGGNFVPSTGALSEFDIYGGKIYAEREGIRDVKVKSIVKQTGLALPISGKLNDTTAKNRDFLIKENATSLDPSKLPRTPASVGAGSGEENGITYIFKLRSNNTNSQSLFQIGDKDSASSFVIGYNSNNIEIRHKTSGATDASQVLDITNHKNKWTTLIVQAYVTSTGAPALSPALLYDLKTGDMLTFAAASTGTAGLIDLSDPRAYIGYGEFAGGVNPAFSSTDFLIGVDIAEFVAISRAFTVTQTALIARSHLPQSQYKSGINSLSPRKVQQALDARVTYPRSAAPSMPVFPQDPFNDTNTMIFGETQELVFPEMLPAHEYSGSNLDTNRGAPGDTRKFFRDVHHTEYDKRLVALGSLNSNTIHQETLQFNESVRNSPVSTSKDTDLLGGTIEPFNDAQPQSRIADQLAVARSTNPDFSQRIGDHVAVVIELDPSEETTVGVERNPDGNTTGRVTSMAYYNFSTKKWETSGKNNDFLVPGALTLSSGSTIGLTKINNGGDKTQAASEAALSNADLLLKSASVAFAGTSGFTIYPNLGRDATSDLKNRALPTSNYGFPTHKKYEPKDGQTIRMSDYISAPFIVERVSFEFGAAIEESGPHSLGYKMPFITSDMAPDSGAGRLEAADLYPGIYFKSNWQGSKDRLVNIAGYSQNDFSSFRRGEFINGSPVINLGDHNTSGFDKGLAAAGNVGPSGFTSSSASPINQLINAFRVNPDITPTHRSSPGYFMTYGNDAAHFDGDSRLNVSSSQINFINPIASKAIHEDPATTAGRPAGRDYSLMDLTASMFLKASSGPRGYGYSERARRNIRNYATQEVRPLSVIPVLAGGMNGVVTGSWYGKSNLNFSDPALGIFTNDADDQRTSTDRSHYSSEGGTPFWRADTFFLLKNMKKPKRTESIEVNVGAGMWSPMVPAVPYLSEQYTKSGANYGWSVSGQLMKMGPGQSSSDPSQDKNTVRYGPVGQSVFITGSFRNRLGVVLRDPETKLIRVIDSYESETTREMITFGQMTHYGYANAPIELEDTLQSTKTPHPSTSGSLNAAFEAQIFDGSNPKTVSLHTQALKIARADDYNFTSVPANVEYHDHIGTKAAISVFSDFPDTAQGSWSPPAEAAGEGNFPVRLTTRDAAGSINITTLFESAYPGEDPVDSRKSLGGLNPRYAASGSAYSYKDDVTNFNETFNSLDTWSLPIIPWCDNSGERPLSADIPVPEFATLYSQNLGTGDIGAGAGKMSYRPEVSMSRIAAKALSPVGSGMSIISSPANLASTFRTSGTDVSGSMKIDFRRFGSFNFNPQYWLGVQSGSEELVNRPTTSWLDAGLRRDTNIFLSASQRHAGTNIDYPDNFCGFTILTASTAQRPFEFPGRESASLPLQANVYKRQYLNYKEDFKIDVPVRANVPSSAETPGYWVFTAGNPRTEFGSGVVASNDTYKSMLANLLSNGFHWNNDASPPGAGAPTYAQVKGLLAANATVSQDTSLATADRMVYSKRYHTRYSICIRDGGWKPGARPGSDRSAASYVASVTARTPVTAQAQSSLPFSGLNTFSVEGFNNSFITPTLKSDDFRGVLKDSATAGTFAKDPTIDSMYVLDPSDEIILGVQPSLPGWNPGSGLPNNRHSSKYGIWNHSASYATGRLKAWDVSDTGMAISGKSEDCFLNLEDPYEPSHGLTMLKVPSRVVLYGSFARGNKPYTSVTKQFVGSDAIHEALHYDNPVLDQFLVTEADQYVGSSLEQLVTGSIFEGTRGVIAAASTDDLLFSGSLQRFKRFSEESEVFFDSLLQNPVEICEASGEVRNVRGPYQTEPEFTLVHMHYPFPDSAKFSSDFIGSLSAVYPVLASGDWPNSFPFEPKFDSVSRMTDRSTAFLPRSTTKGYSQGLATPMISLPPTLVEENVNNRDGSTPGEVNLLTGSSGDIIPYDVHTYYNERKKSGVVTIYVGDVGSQVVGIRNMANTENFVNPTGIPSNTYSRAGSSAEEYRKFAATMIGYGRVNRKQLDFDPHEFLFTYNRGPSLFGLSGQSRRFHPVGFKFGYMNCDHVNPSAVFRADRYGQFRDMLEQRLYSKTFSKEAELSSPGETEAVVSAIFVDRSGTPVEDRTLTSCLNISTFMTASKPFIDEAPPPIDFSSILRNADFLTVDPFSIDLSPFSGV